jgi:hypothetical protein
MRQASNKTFFRGFWVEVGDRLQTYLNKGIRNPAWLIMSVAGRFSLLRHCVKFLAKIRNKQVKDQQLQISLFPDLDVVKISKALKEDGLYTGINLPEDVQSEILEFAYSSPCYGNLEPGMGFHYSEKGKIEKLLGKRFFSAQYFNTSLLCPAIKRLGHDPKLTEIAASYFNSQPVFTGSRLWWNFVVSDDIPYDPNHAITFFHYDLDDYICLRFFFYLTEVDDRAGPHICVRGSHINKHLLYALSPVKRRSDDYIENYYGSENVITINGSAGFGFAEDTFCIHKATRPLFRDRLMLQVQFALHDYGMHNDLKNSVYLKNAGKNYT